MPIGQCEIGGLNGNRRLFIVIYTFGEIHPYSLTEKVPPIRITARNAMSTTSFLPRFTTTALRFGFALVAIVTAALFFSMGPVSAQESPTTTASMTVNANAVTDEGSPQSTEGLVVFIVVVAVIAIGAVIVFYRGWRRKGSQSTQTR